MSGKDGLGTSYVQLPSPISPPLYLGCPCSSLGRRLQGSWGSPMGLTLICGLAQHLTPHSSSLFGSEGLQRLPSTHTASTTPISTAVDAPSPSPGPLCNCMARGAQPLSPGICCLGFSDAETIWSALWQRRKPSTGKCELAPAAPVCGGGAGGGLGVL